jgi:hypothetical protein
MDGRSRILGAINHKAITPIHNIQPDIEPKKVFQLFTMPKLYDA